MTAKFPKAIKAEMLPNLKLKVTFDNQETRFLKTYSAKDSLEKKEVLRPLANAWIGNTIDVLKDGSLKVNETVIPYEKVYLESTLS